MPPKKAAKKKAANGYRMPEHLPEGLALTDLHKNTWTLGRSVGVGGFGEIYLAAKGNDIANDTAKHVVKIEPQENGPLFVEMHFYMNVGRPEYVQEWCKLNKGKDVRMPLLRGNGSHSHKNDTYRFLVIDRFGQDLEKTFQAGKQPLAVNTVYTLALQVLDTLEYIHSKGYTHNDVKAANLLLGLGKDSNNVYLVDFGLCVKYMRGEQHKEYKPDPRKAGDGTVEYCSRDAHIGVTGRRSDLEVLGYNLIHWATGTLPWIKDLASCARVKELKENFMDGLPGTMLGVPTPVKEFMQYVTTLEFSEKPDYEKCRKMFHAPLKKAGLSPQGLISLASGSTANGKKSPVSEIPGKKAKVKGLPTKKPVSLKIDSDSGNTSSDMFSPSPVKKKLTRKKPATKKTVTRKPTAKAASSDSVDNSSDETYSPSPATSKRKRQVMSKLTPPRSSSRSRTPKFREIGSQTSPGFVANSAAAKAAGKAALLKAEGKASLAKKPRSKKVIEANGMNGEDSSKGELLDNPTPAMLEILQRRKEAEEGKEGKKRKTTATTVLVKKKLKA